MTDEGRRRHDATQTVALGVPLPPRPTAVLSAGSTVAERYEVRGVLGSGGFAVVYLARDRDSGDEVALKVLHPERVDEASLRRLRREAEIANRAASPHLVRVRDVGLDGDAPYLALELIQGESLAQRLDGEPLPVEQAVRLARGILAGLEVLHRQGVLHRDVKPGNVLLADDGRVMLVDFGLALFEQHAAPEEVTRSRATVAGAVIGTVEYLSPEQALAEEADPRSDLYSFGVVLFEMLTGRLPCSARSALGTLVAHIQQPAPDVRSLRPEVPAWLAAVVARLLAKKPQERYPSAAAVRADLERRRASGVWRRTGGRWWPRALAAVLAAALLVAGLWGMAGRTDRPVFSHVRQSGDALQGIGERGSVLWTLPDTYGHLLPARLKPGEPVRLVGISLSAEHRANAQPVPLSVLDPLTGREVRRVEMPSAAGVFPGMSNRYWADPHVRDLDGDGYDEILVEYGHKPYWPSYTVLYEPRVERTRVAFVAAGHHRVAGSADFDGDGRRELLFAGHANRMGWYMAAAAVALDPPVNAEPARSGRGVSTPDHAVRNGHRLRPVWYALLPRTTVVDPERVRIDGTARRIRFPAVVGPTVEIDFHGFTAGRRGTVVGGDDGNVSRDEAYHHLREARRLSALGHVDGAVAEARRALRQAERVGDVLLAEWSRRSEAAVLARGDRAAQAEALFRRLADDSEHAAEIAFDAARAFHLGDDPERATAWYRRGLGPGGTQEAGRGRHEYLDGLVFALLELGRGDEALAEILRFRSRVNEDHAAWLAAFVRWRRGADLRPDLPDPAACGTGSLGRVDLHAYLGCERVLDGGADPAALLARVDAEIERSSESVPALLSLRALLLHRLGRHGEAATAAGRAWERTVRERSDNLYARALAGVVAERHDLITGAPPRGVGG